MTARKEITTVDLYRDAHHTHHKFGTKEIFIHLHFGTALVSTEQKFVDKTFATICSEEFSPPDVEKVERLVQIARELLEDKNIFHNSSNLEQHCLTPVKTSELKVVDSLSGLAEAISKDKSVFHYTYQDHRIYLDCRELENLFERDGFKFMLLTLHKLPRDCQLLEEFDFYRDFIYRYVFYNLQIFGVRELDLLCISYL